VDPCGRIGGAVAGSSASAGAGAALGSRGPAAAGSGGGRRFAKAVWYIVWPPYCVGVPPGGRSERAAGAQHRREVLWDPHCIGYRATFSPVMPSLTCVYPRAA